MQLELAPINYGTIMSCNRLKLCDILSDGQQRRLIRKISHVYQDISNVAVRTIAILSVINASKTGSVEKDDLNRCAKYRSDRLVYLQKVADGNDCIASNYFSAYPFLKLLNSLHAAESLLKVNIVSNRHNDEIVSDNASRIKIRWHTVSADLLKCIFELRALGIELHGPSKDAMQGSVEKWLISVRTGKSLLDDPQGPIYQELEHSAPIIPAEFAA